MRIWGLTEDEIRQAARDAQVAIWGDVGDYYNGIQAEGRCLRVRLKVDRTQPRDEKGRLPWQKLSGGLRPKGTAYVRWEGHRNFIANCFRINPEARVKTALADFRGRQNFLDTFRDTQEFDLWQHMYPPRMCWAPLTHYQPITTSYADAMRQYAQYASQMTRSISDSARYLHYLTTNTTE